MIFCKIILFNFFSLYNYIPVIGKLLPIINCDFSTTNCSNPYNIRQKYFMVNEATRGITITFNCFFDGSDNMVLLSNVLIHFDVLATGIFSPHKVEILPFIPNIYSRGYVLLDILRFIIIIACIVLYIIEFFREGKKLKILFSLNTILIIILFIMLLSIIIIKTQYCQIDSAKFFDENLETYTDGYLVAKMQRYAIFLECILAIVTSINISIFSQLINAMNLFFSSISRTLIMFFEYIFVVVILLLGFTVIGNLTWSPYLESYYTFANSFISIMLFTGGYFNARELVLYNVGWTIFFIIVFFVFNLFLLFAVLNSIFAESLRRTVKSKGYPEDGTITQWGMRDFLKWIVHYWPNDKTDEENNS